MQELITQHPVAAALIAFMSAHFGHLTWAQVKQFGAFWESMHGWQGLMRLWKTGSASPEPTPATFILQPHQPSTENQQPKN